jgi:hypothetical protein
VYNLITRQMQQYSTVRFNKSTAGGTLIIITDENRVAALEEKIRVDLTVLIVPERQAL